MDSTTQQIKDILNGGDSGADVDDDQGENNELGHSADENDSGGIHEGTGDTDISDNDAAAGLEDDTAGEEEADTEGNDEPVTLKDLAEQLQLETADLYDVDISLGKGEAVTLGELKDAYKEYGPVKEAREKVEADRDAYERSLMKTRAEINAIVNAIPEAMRENIIRAGRERNAMWEKEQQKAVLEAIPEWQDSDKRASDRDRIVAAGAEYGFSEAEITFTQDARTLRMLRDFTRMKAEIADAKAAAKQGQRGKPGKPSKPASRRLTKKRLSERISAAKASGDMGDKRAVVRDLLGRK